MEGIMSKRNTKLSPTPAAAEPATTAPAAPETPDLSRMLEQMSLP
jgi:hypothetical protein